MEDDEIPYYQETQEPGDEFISKLKRVLTSSLLFVPAFIISNLLLQVFIAWISVALKYTIKFSYNQVRVFPWDYHYWSRTNIIMIFFFAPLLCLLTGLVIFYFLRMYNKRANMFRIFLFWLAVSLVNMVFTHVMLAPLGSSADRNNGLYQTFAVVGTFLWIKPVFMTILSVISLIASLFAGVVIRNEVLRYGFSKKQNGNKRGMDIVAMQVFVLPVLAGSLPLLLLCSSVGFFTTLMEIANLGVVSIGIFIMNSAGKGNVRYIKEDILNHVPVIELAICASVWLAVFIFLK